MPSEFHNREPPLPFGNPKSRPWYGMDIFWNRPFKSGACLILWPMVGNFFRNQAARVLHIQMKYKYKRVIFFLNPGDGHICIEPTNQMHLK